MPFSAILGIASYLKLRDRSHSNPPPLHGEFTRMEGMLEDQQAFGSKRRKTIAKSSGPASFYDVGYRATGLGRPKRHERWRSECASFADPEALIGSVIGQEVGAPSDSHRERASCMDVVLARLAARTEGVRLCEVVQAVENATAGVLDRAATADILARVLRTGAVVRAARQCRDGQRAAGLAAAMIAGLSHSASPARWHKRRRALDRRYGCCSTGMEPDGAPGAPVARSARGAGSGQTAMIRCGRGTLHDRGTRTISGTAEVRNWLEFTFSCLLGVYFPESGVSVRLAQSPRLLNYNEYTRWRGRSC